MSNSPERIELNSNNAEKGSESAGEQLEKLAGKQERGAEISPRDIEARTEKAKAEALESAISVEAGGKEKDTNNGARTVTKRAKKKNNKKEKKDSFKKQIGHVQADLPIISRSFSKIIHNPFIEKTSEIAGSTIARPNALLSGSIFSFGLTLAVYWIAKDIGYALSGFETILAFIVGWTLGIVYDYIRLILTGKK